MFVSTFPQYLKIIFLMFVRSLLVGYISLKNKLMDKKL